LAVNGRYTRSVERIHQLEMGRYEHLQIHIMDYLDRISPFYRSNHPSSARSFSDHPHSNFPHGNAYYLRTLTTSRDQTKGLSSPNNAVTNCLPLEETLVKFLQ
jgi:hypothetical protein